MPFARKVRGDDRRAIIVDYLNGEKLVVIEALHGVTRSAAIQMVRRGGITVRPKRGRPTSAKPRRDWLIVFTETYRNY